MLVSVVLSCLVSMMTSVDHVTMGGVSVMRAFFMVTALVMLFCGSAAWAHCTPVARVKQRGSVRRRYAGSGNDWLSDRRAGGGADGVLDGAEVFVR